VLNEDPGDINEAIVSSLLVIQFYQIDLHARNMYMYSTTVETSLQSRRAELRSNTNSRAKHISCITHVRRNNLLKQNVPYAPPMLHRQRRLPRPSKTACSRSLATICGESIRMSLCQLSNVPGLVAICPCTEFPTRGGSRRCTSTTRVECSFPRLNQQNTPLWTGIDLTHEGDLLASLQQRGLIEAEVVYEPRSF